LPGDGGLGKVIDPALSDEHYLTLTHLFNPSILEQHASLARKT